MRRAKVAAVLALVVVSFLGVGPDLASAYTRAGCSSGNGCVWEDSNFNTNGSTSARKDFSLWDGSFHNENYVGTAVNAGDSATSAWNSGTAQTVSFFIDTGCSGPQVNLVVNGSGVSTFGATFNNEISSGAFSGSIGSC
jgi:hypothetical protein